MQSKILDLETSKFRIWTGTQIQIYELAHISLKFNTISSTWSPPGYWRAPDVKCYQIDKQGSENNEFALKIIQGCFCLGGVFVGLV